VAEQVEHEVKLRVADVDGVRRLLLDKGAELLRPRYFEDNLLLDDGSGGLAAAGRILRIRRTPRGGRLTYKAPYPSDEGVKSREEIELPIAEPDAMELILAKLGFEPTFRYQKYREVYRYSGLEIAVDETPIGSFVEVEGATAGIHSVASELGFGREDYITESYFELFRTAGGRGDMVFA
jgi:adenylate cyclase class 2